MKKQNIDAGLAYVKKVGIKAAKDRNSIKKDMESRFGKKETDTFFKEFNDLCENDNNKSYDYKNSDYEKSILFTGSFDADIIRKFCNWVDDNKEYFGKNILDVGCDCGFMTCFLGLALPESNILSIDRSENGVSVAKKLAESLGVSNVTFKKSELCDLEEGEFDTVFSMRTAMENVGCVQDYNKTFVEQAESLKGEFTEFGNLLASKVKEDGNLITIENAGSEVLLAGWIEALYESGFTGSVDKYKEIMCKEIGYNVDYHVLVLTKSKVEESGMEFFIKICDSKSDYYSGELRGWKAKFIYEIKKDELLDGFTVGGPGAIIGSVFSLWTFKNEPEKLIFYQNHEGEPILQIHHKNRRKKIDGIMKFNLENAKKYSALKIEKL